MGVLDSFIKKPVMLLQHPDDSARCVCAETEGDAFTGNTVCMLPAQPFFTFTPTPYIKFLKGEPFLQAKVALAKNGNVYVLHLYIDIASDKIHDRFGDVAAHTFLNIELLRHRPVLCITHQGARAVITPGKTSYHAIYTMDSQDARLLGIGEVSRVRLHWTKGKQTFDVFDVDVLNRQFKCWKQ